VKAVSGPRGKRKGERTNLIIVRKKKRFERDERKKGFRFEQKTTLSWGKDKAGKDVDDGNEGRDRKGLRKVYRGHYCGRWGPEAGYHHLGAKGKQKKRIAWGTMSLYGENPDCFRSLFHELDCAGKNC